MVRSWTEAEIRSAHDAAVKQIRDVTGWQYPEFPGADLLITALKQQDQETFTAQELKAAFSRMFPADSKYGTAEIFLQNMRRHRP